MKFKARLLQAALGVSLLGLPSLVAPVHAADDNWWFDIEVIVFKRNLDVRTLPETFELESPISTYSADWDVISKTLRPDVSQLQNTFPSCDPIPHPLWREAPTIEAIIADYEQAFADEIFAAQEAARLAETSPQTLAEAAPAQEPLLNGNELNHESLDNTLDDPAFDDIPSGNSDLEAEQTARSQLDVASLAQQAGQSIGGEHTTLADETPDAPLLEPSWNEQQIAEAWLEFHLKDALIKEVSIPNVKRLCEKPAQWSGLSTLALQLQDTLYPSQPPEVEVTQPQYPDKVSIVLEGADWARHATPHLLSSKQLELTELSKNIRWAKGMERMLHVAWRQPVKFGQNKADTVHLFAGENFGLNFMPDGSVIPPEPEQAQPLELETQTRENTQLALDRLFTEESAAEPLLLPQLKTKLNDPQPVSFNALTSQEQLDENGLVMANKPIWELDGYMKVFLKYINRVPYLHIDSEMHFRQPVVDDASAPQDAQLVSIPFKQVRRVISKQVHYFDHPLFGMVVEIRRYRRPAAPTTTPQ